MPRTFLAILACALLAPPAVAESPIRPAAAWRRVMPAPDLARFDRLAARVASAYDTSAGGYVSRAGVPYESAVELALAQGGAGLGAQWTEHAEFTLGWMEALVDSTGAGYYDHRLDSDHGG